MRRGLIARSPVELPDAAFESRLDNVRCTMLSPAKFDALIVYTNNTRPAGVSWLTGFVPYWSEALLVVPREGAPFLVVALTFRVKTWIERTSRVAEVIHTPRIGLEAARRIAAMKPDAAVGVVELDLLSAGIADDIKEGGPRLDVIDASEHFARQRTQADPAEIALTAKAATIAHQALAQAPPGATDAGRTIAAVEAAARELGAEEIYLAAAPDVAKSPLLRRIEGEAALGVVYALRASVAYKGSWARMVRTIDRDRRGIDRQAAATFAAAVADLPDDRALAASRSWLVEGCRLTQPLEAVMGPHIASPRASVPDLVSVQACIDIDGAPVLIGAPALMSAYGGAASLLVAPVFD